MSQTTVVTERGASVAPVEPPHAARRYTTLRQAWIPMTALCLAFFVEMVDNTVLNIALPTIGRDLHSSTTQLQWVSGAYSLTFGGMLLTAGSIADRFGRRRVLLVGLGAFGLLSALVLGIHTTHQLIALRAILGIAAAAMAPVTNSLVFRLFDDEAPRMRAISLMMVVGMSGFALGPIGAGTVLAHIRWQWLLLINLPIALVAVLGVWRGVPADEPEDLHPAPLDIPGALLTMASIGLFSYTFTSGVDHGWRARTTIACGVGAVVAMAAFVWRERTAREPMLDLSLFRNRTVRGASFTQLGSNVAMAGAMFAMMMHFQYALGWSPMKAGLANLPFVITMLAATPFIERLVAAVGHRVSCLIGTVLLIVSLLGLTYAMGRPYWVLALAMVVLTIGLRIIMTICAVALVEAMPENRTSIGAAINDTAQELGTSVGISIVGTVLAAVVGTLLPAGAWDRSFVELFFHGERVTYLVLAAVVAVVSLWGSSTLTDSRSADEPH